MKGTQMRLSGGGYSDIALCSGCTKGGHGGAYTSNKKKYPHLPTYEEHRAEFHAHDLSNAERQREFDKAGGYQNWLRTLHNPAPNLSGLTKWAAIAGAAYLAIKVGGQVLHTVTSPLGTVTSLLPGTSLSGSSGSAPFEPSPTTDPSGQTHLCPRLCRIVDGHTQCGCALSESGVI